MAADFDALDLIKVGLSSAVFSSLINVGWSAWNKRQERKLEVEKEQKRINHVFLEVALQLESFAHRCSIHINEIETQVSYAKQFHDDSGFASLTPVTFEFSPEPDWTELPIDFTAKIKVLPKQFADSNKWILEAYGYWADTFDALDLDVERLAFYGKKACEEAGLIRRNIGAGDGQMDASIANFEAVFRSRRKRLAADQDAAVIPELKELLASEQAT